MTPWLSLAISLVSLVVAVVFMRRMIDQRTGSAAALDEVRREVGAILTEMNQTTERNIELVEDRISTLRTALASADRKLLLLQNEIGKQRKSEELYAELGRSSLTRGDPIPEADTSSADRPPIGADTVEPKEAAPPPVAMKAPQPEPEPEPELTLRDRVLGLYRQGIPLERIASRVGTAVGEVELIVSLSERG